MYTSRNSSESPKQQWLLREPDWADEPGIGMKSENCPSYYFETLKTFVERKDWLSLKQYLEIKEYQEVVNFLPPGKHARPLLHSAALQLDPECLKSLLDAEANPNLKDGFGRSSLHCAVSQGCRCVPCIGKRLRCMELLIKAGSVPNAEDNKRETPLYYTARNMYPKCAKFLLENGANLYHWNEDTNIAALLAEYLPDVLTSQLDQCVGYDAHNSLDLTVDFRLLLQIQEDSIKARRKLPQPETKLLQSVLKAGVGKEIVVTHPVVEAFLHLKWTAVRRIFFFLRSIYFALVILYTYLMLNIYTAECLVSEPPVSGSGIIWVSNSNSTDKTIETIGTNSNANACVKMQNLQNFAIGCLLYFSTAIILISELYKICQNHSEYFSSKWLKSTWYLWWILIFCWAVTLLPVLEIPEFEYQYKWQLPFAAVSVIFSWLMNLEQLARMPWFAVHVGLFVKVVKDFVKLLVTFSTVLIAFALGFYILLPTTFVPEYRGNPFGFFFAFFKVFIMMKGDIDYDGLLLATHPKTVDDFIFHSIPAHLIYGGFVIMVTLLLTALLIGLAVKDMEEIRKQAKVNHSIRLITEIVIFEKLIRNPILTCGLSRFLHKRYSIAGLREVKGYCVKVSPVNPEDTTLPQNIKEMFLPYLSTCPCQQSEFLRIQKSVSDNDTK